ncbi:putative glutamyl-tRNA amidotransferase subunit A [Rhizodiscina lignyota]|uniref:amidase n=1 Tax=Rhizodiscina lignyota TaxID=1504668 RepID=A0A9P4M979_9PEZI|nr:putative glutamyl-tRNA amidotransferase subunit A [Rhizodiscina lignyota]
MPTWQETCQLMRDYRDETISKIRPQIPDLPSNVPLNASSVPGTVLKENEIRITESSTEDLLSQLSTGHLTAVEVTNAFLRRAGIAHKLVNCITEVLPDRALERAEYLDEYLAAHKKPIGPLHGLPISVKEHIAMKGLDLNAAFVSWVGRVAKKDALILTILWEAGAVFYARTTEPQLLMHLETSSNLYGETVCGFNRNLTSGGSSGGEGALIGMRGSCLGIGTDIGGSIRNPAANNGLWGFKPTSHRLPLVGCSAPALGQEHIAPAIGPISTTLGGIKIFMKTLIDAKPWLSDPSLLPFAWRDRFDWLANGGERKVKIAVLWDDDIVRPHPPVLRALKEVTERLRHVDGVELVDWKPYKHDVAWDIISALYYCDGGKEDEEVLAESGEPWRPLSTWVIKDNPNVKERHIRETWDLQIKRDVYREEYNSLWGDVDVILSPVGPGAAPPLNCARYWQYTAQWNLLDIPSLVFPVTSVDPAVDVKESDYVPRNEKDKYNYDLYEPELYRDAPICLQLSGCRYEDEKVVQIAEFMQQQFDLPLKK